MRRVRAVATALGTLVVVGCGAGGGQGTASEPEPALHGPSLDTVSTAVEGAGFCHRIRPRHIAALVAPPGTAYELTQELEPGEAYRPFPPPATPTETSHGWRCSYEPRSWDVHRSIGVRLAVTAGTPPGCAPGDDGSGLGDQTPSVGCSRSRITRGTYSSPFAHTYFGERFGGGMLECLVYARSAAARDAVVAATPEVCSLFLATVTE
jgi:hypothetical protein